MKKIILVDDHVIIRNGLKELIEKLGSYTIVAQYDNGRDFVNTFPLRDQPDLIIMDISMPEMDGDEVVEVMNIRGMKCPVLILTLSHDENKLAKLFRQGVRGYLQKNCTAAMMKQALEEIFKRGYFHNEDMSLGLTAKQNTNGPLDTTTIKERLSEREKDFIKLACDENEYTYREIAELMSVQHRTVDGYRQSIFEKFGIKSKAGLVLFALKHKLIENLP
ncbi:MAG: response regulator transcription factor [Chitinophagaceae bacterium]|nr:response regulator transcription factor [Chitinophagaceae bacterium]